MPDELKRLASPPGSHILSLSPATTAFLISTTPSHDVFVAALEWARLRYRFRVYGFVVMPDTSIYSIAEPELGTIANGIQSLKISSTKRTTADCERDGQRFPLWQKRYYDRNVRDSVEQLSPLCTSL